MDYKRMPIEIEAPEQLGYGNVKYNLTESSVTDTVYSEIRVDINTLKLAYGDHAGKTELRDLIANESENINKENVLITAGAASALFIVATSLLEKEDHLVVIRPNYASNIETPRAIGCGMDFVDLKFEDDWQISVADIKSKIKKNTRLISVTHPHNPTGMCIPEGTLLEIAELADKHNCYLLVDETYRELNHGKIYPIGASLHKRIITVCSLSKAYGMPGIRIGWLVTQDPALNELFLAAKEQIFVCNSVIDEEIAYQYLLKKDEYFASIRKHIDANLSILHDWLKSETRIEMVIPQGGVVCFPRIKNGENMDLKKFYSLLNSKYETFVGPGYWFEMPEHFMRIGFGWPASEELAEGLKRLSLCLNDFHC